MQPGQHGAVRQEQQATSVHLNNAVEIGVRPVFKVNRSVLQLKDSSGMDDDILVAAGRDNAHIVTHDVVTDFIVSRETQGGTIYQRGRGDGFI